MLSRLILFLVPACLLTVGVRAQQDSLHLSPPRALPMTENCESIGLVTGIHQGSNTFFELGFVLQQEHNSRCAFGYFTRALSLSAEYNPFQNRAGLSFSAWNSALGLLTMGCNVNTYSDFKTYNLGLKPFIGLGPGYLNVCYGYNFQLINNRITDLNKHSVSLRATFAVFKHCR